MNAKTFVDPYMRFVRISAKHCMNNIYLWNPFVWRNNNHYTIFSTWNTTDVCIISFIDAIHRLSAANILSAGIVICCKVIHRAYYIARLRSSIFPAAVTP